MNRTVYLLNEQLVLKGSHCAPSNTVPISLLVYPYKTYFPHEAITRVNIWSPSLSLSKLCLFCSKYLTHRCFFTLAFQYYSSRTVLATYCNSIVTSEERERMAINIGLLCQLQCTFTSSPASFCNIDALVG